MLLLVLHQGMSRRRTRQMSAGGLRKHLAAGILREIKALLLTGCTLWGQQLQSSWAALLELAQGTCFEALHSSSCT